MTAVHVIPIEVHLSRGVRTVVITCPFCKKRHTHGWPLGSTEPPGSRVPHCLGLDKPSQYFIELPAAEVTE